MSEFSEVIEYIKRLGAEAQLLLPKEAALKQAIRAFTADTKQNGIPVPNGPAEEAFCRLCDAIRAMPTTPETMEIFRLGEEWCKAEEERTRALRIAAEDLFGEDFRSCPP